MSVKPTSIKRQAHRSAERQHSHARRCLVDRKQRATLDVVPVRFDGVSDSADDLVREKVVLVRPSQDLSVGRGCRTDGGPVDSLE
jgi:hypothetical protein